MTLRAVLASNCESVPSPAPRSATVSGGSKRDHRVRERLPGAARAITAAEFSRELIEIFARLVLPLAQNEFERASDRAASPAFRARASRISSLHLRACGSRSCRSLGRSKHSSRRDDPPPLRRASTARDDSRCATAPCPRISCSSATESSSCSEQKEQAQPGRIGQEAEEI